MNLRWNGRPQGEFKDGEVVVGVILMLDSWPPVLVAFLVP